MKKSLLLACVCATAFAAKSQTISDAKLAGDQAAVTIHGVCINNPENGSTRYIVDAVSGIAAYGTNMTTLMLGDSVELSGTLTNYHSLWEIKNVTYNVLKSGAVIPAPFVITPSQVNESQESTLVKILNCTFGTTGTFASGTSYTITSNGQQAVIFPGTGSPLLGTPIPTGAVDITAVVSQYCSNSDVACSTGYELAPRNANDIVAAGSVGIQEFSKVSKIGLFPNPTASVINFALTANENVNGIKVYDILGNTVFTSHDDIRKVDVSSFAKGVYSISITAGATTYLSKFIVE